MSLYSALFAGVSGLSAQSSAMATVADNINNVNTVGYKGTQAGFSSLVTGGDGGSYSAGGVDMVAQSLISKGMSSIAGTASTNMAVDGNGFFVVRSQPDGTDAAFTRAGNFIKDDDGNLKNSAGYFLQGWPLDRDGKYVDNGSLSGLSTVNVNGLGNQAEPTRTIPVALNLDSRADVYAGPPAYTDGAMAAGTVTPQFSFPTTIYDGEGNAHGVRVGFIKTAANQWHAEMFVQPASDVSQANGLLASGDVAFTPFGQLDLTNPSALFGSVTPAWTNGAGAGPLTLVGNSKLGNWTQTADVSARGQLNPDGGKLGQLTSVNVSNNGVVTATFDSGRTRDLYQLPLATFPNPDGLSRLTGDAFQVSKDSGNVIFGAAQTNGSGKIAGGKLETSTTDLAGEFTNMIVYQRAYSASSKIITTVDEMLQDLNNLKR